MNFIEIMQLVIKTLSIAMFKVTIPLTIVTFVLGMIVGLITALFRISNNKILDSIARVYISIFRGTPLLIQLFILFYGLPRIGLVLPPVPTAIIGFTLNIGAYASETIRASINAIPIGQWEAATSLGMTYTQMMRRIILPQAVRIAVPPLSNTFIGLVKDTSLASLVLVPEMFRKAQEYAAMTNRVLEVYIVAAFLYWVVCSILSKLQNRVESKLNVYTVK